MSYFGYDSSANPSSFLARFVLLQVCNGMLAVLAMPYMMLREDIDSVRLFGESGNGPVVGAVHCCA